MCLLNMSNKNGMDQFTNLVLILVSCIFLIKATPVLQKQIQDATTTFGSQFSLVIDTLDHFSGTNGEIFVNITNTPSLPSWLTVSRVTPETIGHFTETACNAISIDVQGDFVYLIDSATNPHNPAFRILDISNISNIENVGNDFLTDADFRAGVTVKGDFAYVIDSYLGSTTRSDFKIYNIADKSQPQLKGNVETRDASGLFVSGNYAYVADATRGVKIINITDITTPTVEATHDTGSRAEGIIFRDNFMFVADYNGGLVIINATDFGNLQTVGSTGSIGTLYSVKLSGDYAITAAFEIFDISDITRPISISSITGLTCGDVHLEENFAYLSCVQNGWVIVDIRDKYNPKIVEELDVPVSSPAQIAVKPNEHRLFIADGMNCMNVVQFFKGVQLSGTSAKKEDIVVEYAAFDNVGVEVSGSFTISVKCSVGWSGDYCDQQDAGETVADTLSQPPADETTSPGDTSSQPAGDTSSQPTGDTSSQPVDTTEDPDPDETEITGNSRDLHISLLWTICVFVLFTVHF